MQKGELEKSATAEHVWNHHHPILCEETSVIDRASKRRELLVKEMQHTQLTPKGQRFNRDLGMELPDCCV